MGGKEKKKRIFSKGKIAKKGFFAEKATGEGGGSEKTGFFFSFKKGEKGFLPE